MEHEMHFSFKEFKPLTFCGKPMAFGGDVSVFQKPFEIKPTNGKHSLKSCKKCKANLAELTQRLTDLFNGKLDKAPFPHCCVPHSNLLKEKNFDRSDFVKVPEQAAKKTMYAYHHIINHVNDADWKENITDYIDWAERSFGQFPAGCGQPLFLNSFVGYLCGLVQNSTDIPEEKKAYVLHYLKGDQQVSPSNDTDLQALLTTYEKWLTLFPFGVDEFFGDLKSSFQKRLPLIKNGSIHKNRYSGTVVMQLCTEGELVERLMQISKDLLSKVNSKTLYEKGLITDKEKHRFDLISETHRVKQATLLNNYNTGEVEYAELLGKWLENEKAFFAEVEPSVKIKIDAQANKTGKIREALVKHGFCEIPSVKKLSNSQQEKLFELIIGKELPYQIAMLSYLGYFDYLLREQFDTKNELNKHVGTWLNAGNNIRSVKGNINVLVPNSKEDKKKYTAYIHKKAVEKDYQNLK